MYIIKEKCDGTVRSLALSSRNIGIAQYRYQSRVEYNKNKIVKL